MGIQQRAPELGDIRPQLKDRLSIVEGKLKAHDVEFEHQRRELEARFRLISDELVDERNSVLRMLEIEDRRFAEAPTPAPVIVRKRPLRLDDFLVRAIEAEGPQTKDQLRDWVASEGYAANGRAIHFTLINLVRGGRIKKLPDGTFALAVQQQPGFKIEVVA